MTVDPAIPGLKVELSGGPLCGCRVSDVGPVLYGTPYESSGLLYLSNYSPAPIRGRRCFRYVRRQTARERWYQYADEWTPDAEGGMTRGDGYREAA